MPEPTLRDLIDERHKAHADEHRIHERAHEREHVATETAIATATANLDKRLDTMNEFRDQLRDQAATFIRRDQFEAFVAHYERAHDEVLQLVATEREERRANEGKSKGVGQSFGWIIASIGLVGSILGIIIVLSNVLTTR